VSQMYKMPSRFRTILSISCSLVISGSHSRTLLYRSDWCAFHRTHLGTKQRIKSFSIRSIIFLWCDPRHSSRIRRRFDSRLLHQCSSAFHWSLSFSMLDLFRQCIDVRERFKPFTQTLYLYATDSLKVLFKA
jgi:hypothetical protein